MPAAAGWGGERLGGAVADSFIELGPTTVPRPVTSATMPETTLTLPTTMSSMTMAPSTFAPPQPVRYVTTCPTPGAGWVVSWVWPGDLPDGLAGYRVRTQEDDGTFLLRPSVGVWDDPADPPVAIRLGSTDFAVFTDLVGPDGDAVATAEQPFVAPSGTC